jgi:hypothetical protein
LVFWTSIELVLLTVTVLLVAWLQVAREAGPVLDTPQLSASTTPVTPKLESPIAAQTAPKRTNFVISYPPV